MCVCVSVCVCLCMCVRAYVSLQVLSFIIETNKSFKEQIHMPIDLSNKITVITVDYYMLGTERYFGLLTKK